MITTILLLGIIVFVNKEIHSIDVLALSGIFLIIAYWYERRSTTDWLLYLAAVFISTASLFFNVEVVRIGAVGFGLLNVVMFTGVLPDRWDITKKLKGYRAVYSILGVILVIPHASLNLFVDRDVSIFGIAALVIMLPLFITSFELVKKEMKLTEWVKLQKAAYLVYVLLFIHLIAVGDWYGKVIYAVMMTLYINNKLVKELAKRQQRGLTE